MLSMLRFFVCLGCAAWALALVASSRAGQSDGVGNWQPRGAPGTVVGPSAMLEWQRHGAPVFDARRSGRFVSHTQKILKKISKSRVPQDKPILVIAASKSEALRVSPRALWVPSGLLEIPLRRGVRQMSPSQVLEGARRGDLEVVDVSEVLEWQWERLPIGRRVDWMRVRSRDRSWISEIPRGKTIVFACRLGGRSQIAAQTLAREGFVTANLSGGVWAWQGAGLPIEKGGADG